jgi:holo-[acyl-carrier protein] synthase
MLIGLGHDLQGVRELAAKEALLSEGGCFTEAELARIVRSPSPAETAAGLFAAKEAFLKATPPIRDGFWTDVEVRHSRAGAPSLRLHGAYRDLFERQGWRALVSVSHSGGFASCVVMVVTDTVAGGATP